MHEQSAGGKNMSYGDVLGVGSVGKKVIRSPNNVPEREKIKSRDITGVLRARGGTLRVFGAARVG